tara:strand:- start:114 stop:566 length:453 start_codon:yes stop_codon:yes gene_type:complete
MMRKFALANGNADLLRRGAVRPNWFDLMKNRFAKGFLVSRAERGPCDAGTRYNAWLRRGMSGGKVSGNENGKPLKKASRLMVGARGFEPPTPASRRQCSTRLSYAPSVGGCLARLQGWIKHKPVGEPEKLCRFTTDDFTVARCGHQSLCG